LFCTGAVIITEACNITENENYKSANQTESDTEYIKPNFVHVQYEYSDTYNKSSSAEQTDIILKAGTIKTNVPSKSMIYSMNISNVSSMRSSSKSNDEYDYYIVQFNDTVQEGWKENILMAGGQVFDYIPYNAFIVKMNESTLNIVSTFEYVRWIGKYLPSYKIDPSLKTKMSENISMELFVSFFQCEDKENVRKKVIEELRSLRGTILEENNDDRILISIGSSKISAISDSKDVKWIEEYKPFIVFNDMARGIINASYVSENYSLTGRRQIIAIADTGLDTGINNESMNPDFYGRILAILDIAGDGAEDKDGHGTHVAGSAVGNGSLSNGKYKGIAPEAQLVFQAIGTSDGNLNPRDLNNLFEEAYELGARIHSNSWGGTSYFGEYTIESRDVDKFMWTHPDMLIVFAAGNYGTDKNKDGIIDFDSISYPGTAKNCLTVGASENYRGNAFGLTWSSFLNTIEPICSDYTANNPRGIAAFSGRGPTDDGRIKPDIVAPGTYIISVNSSVSDSRYAWKNLPTNKHYIYMGGTSMATPLAAGSVALIRQNYVENLNITPSAALLKATIINGATNLKPGQYGNDVTAQPDYNQGWGLLNLKESLYPSDRAIYFADNIKISTGDTVEKNYYVKNNSKYLKSTLVWTDYYGSQISGGRLVNDLTLMVVQPNGTEVVVTDTVNNVEQILFEQPEIGWYTVKVIGESVPIGPQPFAIVVSGAANVLNSLNFTPQQTIYHTGESTTFEAKAIDENNNSFDAVFRWESSNSSVGCVNSSTGYFKALAGGVTDITVYAGTMSSTVSIKVVDTKNLTITDDDSSGITNEENDKKTTSSPSRSSSGGGNGGGGTGENLANVLIKEPLTLFVNRENNIKYEFKEENNSIISVEFKSLKNSGKITTVVEVLKSRSSFAKIDAPGKVYQNLNIWVGKAGFASANNIADSKIAFKVKKEWLSNNNVDIKMIRLYRYGSEGWSELPTKIINEDYQYAYFESETPGFSPFAISTAETTINILNEAFDIKNDTQCNEIKPSDQFLMTTTNCTETVSLENQNKSSEDKVGDLVKYTILFILLIIGINVYRYKKVK
jgi:PGF-pre-PGF domain-containing protein